MLCKHEVVGSIPTGSTSLRRLRLLRLGKPECSEGCRAEAHLGVGGPAARQQTIRPRDNISHLLVLTGITEDCVLSDIVKRRSIRVGSCNGAPPRKRSALRLCTDTSLSPGHFGARHSMLQSMTL